jgi:hypothetical protein
MSHLLPAALLGVAARLSSLGPCCRNSLLPQDLELRTLPRQLVACLEAFFRRQVQVFRQPLPLLDRSLQLLAGSLQLQQ